MLKGITEMYPFFKVQKNAVKQSSLTLLLFSDSAVVVAIGGAVIG